MTSVKMATSMAQTNLSLLRQHLSIAVGNSSVVVKSVAVAVICGYFLTFAQSVIPYVAVTPGYVIPPNFWFWTFLTHAFIEVHFWDVLVDIAVVILCGKLLEPLWGALDMLLFFLIVNTGVAVVTAFSYLAFYLVSKNEEFLFETYIHGLAGYVAGFAVAVKQVMPDHVLVTSPFGKLRNTHIPLLLLFVVVTLRLAGLLDGPYPFMFGYGILISWIYLRFYQKHTNGNRGDMADNFGFPSFFPGQLQPFVGMFSNTVFLALVKVKICKKPQRKYDVSSPSTITITLPGTDQDAERRRQVAIKALNERMNKSEQPASWPSLVDEDGKASPESSASPAKESLVKPIAKLPDTQEQHEQKQVAQPATNTES